jgi:hypothetical protein
VGSGGTLSIGASGVLVGCPSSVGCPSAGASVSAVADGSANGWISRIAAAVAVASGGESVARGVTPGARAGVAVAARPRLMTPVRLRGLNSATMPSTSSTTIRQTPIIAAKRGNLGIGPPLLTGSYLQRISIEGHCRSHVD